MAERAAANPTQSYQIDVSCAHLDLMRQQLAETGQVTVTSSRPITPARRAIVESIAGNKIVFRGADHNFSFDVPRVEDPLSVSLMESARKEADNSPCWLRKVGCVLTDRRNRVVSKTHNRPTLEGEFCQTLDLSPVDVMKLLGKDASGEPERLNFCQGIHAEELALVLGNRPGRSALGKHWVLSLESCDRCAGQIIHSQPLSFSFSNPKRGQGGSQVYYNSLGLERLLMANVPVRYVSMPGDEVA